MKNGRVMKKKIVVISMDALVFEDIKYLSDKPSFSHLLKNGSMVERLRSIYPTMTYPCHTTMSTGAYPDKHGIVNNTFDIPVKNPPWIFEHSNVKCEDILDAAKHAGYTTAAVGWPITGLHKNVDYLINECWPVPDGPIEDYEKAYIESGTPQYLFDEVVAPYLPLRVGRKQPESSLFLAYITADILRKYNPDILLLHFGVLDAYRHKTGVFSEKVTEGLDVCEEILTLLFNAAREAGTFDDINWIVTADHGQLNFAKKIHLNALFHKHNLIDVDENGNVVAWRAFAFASGMSAQVHVKNVADREKIYEILKEAKDSGLWGISEIYDKARASAEHLSGEFEFVVEGDGATAFGNEVISPYAIPANAVLTGLCQGSHGYHPDKAPRPTFIASGPNIKRGVVLKDGNLVDGAPTYAEILGISLPDADGTPFYEIIGEDNNGKSNR